MSIFSRKSKKRLTLFFVLWRALFWCDYLPRIECGFLCELVIFFYFVIAFQSFKITIVLEFLECFEKSIKATIDKFIDRGFFCVWWFFKFAFGGDYAKGQSIAFLPKIGNVAKFQNDHQRAFWQKVRCLTFSNV